MKPPAEPLKHFAQPAGVVFGYALCIFGARIIVVVSTRSVLARVGIVTHAR
jgi:hypothetical protein